MVEKTGMVLDGKYELVRKIGEGGMGSVYEANHKLIGRRLAVKFLHPQYASSDEVVTRFQREARTLAQLDEIPITVAVLIEGAPVGPLFRLEIVEQPVHVAVRSKAETGEPVSQIIGVESPNHPLLLD